MNKRSVTLWSVSLLVIASSALTICIAVVGTHMLNSLGRLKQPVTAADHRTGDAGAPVKLVIYSDFACASCGNMADNLKALQALYGDRLCVVYRHFPLPAHKNSFDAACAAEAAGKQGRYFEMSDLLFKNEADWSELEDKKEVHRLLLSYADSAKLSDMKRFEEDMRSCEVTNKVFADLKGALDSSARGTPAVYLNGRLLPPNLRLQHLKGAIDEALR